MRAAAILVLAINLGGCAAADPARLQGVPEFPEPAHVSASAPDGFGGPWWLTRASRHFSAAMVYEVRDGVAYPAPFSNGGYDVAPGHWREGVLFTSTRETGWDLWHQNRDGQLSRLPEPINTGSSECCSVPLPGGNFLFSSDRNGDWSIYEVVVTPGNFEVRPLTGQVNSEYGEWPSYVSPDGNLLLFSSIRPDGAGGDDIYVSQRGREGWSAPCRLPAPVNRAGYEDSASLVGDRLVWSSRPPEAGALSRIYTLPAELALSACGIAP